ncbi:BnaC09g30020D [Brassica napus]|uniref:BnaC09g30020D protein n=1 Tax=Brassica napus TaxID=3708 RepID=A0A078G5J7_BRANA|nr:BnaC09g30020D [Brassica napus]
MPANRRCHLLCTLRLFEGWLSLLRPGPPPKLLRNKEYEALRQAYGVDILLLDPKAVVTATMVLERPD